MKKDRLHKLTNGHLWNVMGGVMGDFPDGDGLEDKLRRFRNLGVRTVIDVRYPGQDAEHLNAICGKFGLEYFYYPLNRHRGYTQQMDDDSIRLFPRFCKMIENGDFFLCGRPEATLAIVIYWIFYGADKGLFIPQLFEPGIFSFHLPYDEDPTLIGDIRRVVDGMQSRFTEFGLSPLTKNVLDLRMPRIWEYRNIYSKSKYPEGDYSFLTISAGQEYGRYRITMRKCFLGWMYEPDRSCDDWRYSIEYKDHNISGKSSSFEEAKKELFDCMYRLHTPEEYLALMNLCR